MSIVELSLNPKAFLQHADCHRISDEDIHAAAEKQVKEYLSTSGKAVTQKEKARLLIRATRLLTQENFPKMHNEADEKLTNLELEHRAKTEEIAKFRIGPSNNVLIEAELSRLGNILAEKAEEVAQARIEVKQTNLQLHPSIQKEHDLDN